MNASVCPLLRRDNSQPWRIRHAVQAHREQLRSVQREAQHHSLREHGVLLLVATEPPEPPITTSSLTGWLASSRCPASFSTSTSTEPEAATSAVIRTSVLLQEQHNTAE